MSFTFHLQASLKTCVQVFLDRLSRVISSVETRASQYLDIENEVANSGASWSIIHREIGGGPLIINPIYTLYTGYLLGI